MELQAQLSAVAFLAIAKQVEAYASATNSGYEADPAFLFKVEEVQRNFLGQRQCWPWYPLDRSDRMCLYDRDLIVTVYVIDVRGKWTLTCRDGQAALVYSGSRDGWQIGIGPLAAAPGVDDIARIAGQYARITAVDDGLDPWLTDAEVAALCREQAALVAPALPGEEEPMRAPFSPRNMGWGRLHKRPKPRKPRPWKETRQHQYRWVLV